MPPYAVATVHAALQIIKSEPERRTSLIKNADYLRNGLKALGFDTATSETPIIPVVIGDFMTTFKFWRGAVRQRRVRQLRRRPGGAAERVPHPHVPDRHAHRPSSSIA